MHGILVALLVEWSCSMGFFQDLRRMKTLLIIILTPILALPLPILGVTTQARCAYVVVIMLYNALQARCAYVVVIMAVYWVAEALPMAVTGLIPVILFPMMNVVKARDISNAYVNDTVLLFLGGLTVAVAIEHWNLHRKIALKILMLVGAEPRWLMFGLMISSWFLSMWISNTATTSMMIPIAEAILFQLKGTHELVKEQETKDEEEETVHDTSIADNGDVTVAVEFKAEKVTEGVDAHNGGSTKVVTEAEAKVVKHSTPKSDSDLDDAAYERHHSKMCKALSLSICYASNAGGICSLTGTGPNLVLKGQTDILYEKYGATSPVNFASWMLFGLPLGFIVLIITWVWLQIHFLRCRGCLDCLTSDEEKKKQAARVKKVIRDEYERLGNWTFAQYCVLIDFCMLVVLWISRDLGGIGGWGDFFDEGMVKDSTPAILACVLLFICPSTVPAMFCLNKDDDDEDSKTYKPLLDWKTVNEKMPWGLFLLVGGGYALALACEESGLSLWIGMQLTVFKNLHPYLMLLILCYICAAATEVTSNTAIATLVLPIMSSLAINTGVNPLFYMFPTCLATSFAYMLPVATPPNAIVFSYGHLRILDMVSAGFILNVLAVPLLLFATATWGTAQFDFQTLPEAFRQNITMNVTTVL